MHRALVLALVLALPTVLAAGYKPVDEVMDPARDIGIYRNVILTPVDSIDIVHARLERSEQGITGATVRVVDLDRRGVEDVLFVHRTHAARPTGILALLEEDGRPVLLVMLAASVEPALDGFSRGYLAVRIEDSGRFTFLNATGFHDGVTDAVGIRLKEAVRGEIVFFGVLSALLGCDSVDACESPTAVVSLDIAPDGGENWIATVIPSKSFADIFPEDDGSMMGTFRAVYAALQDAQDVAREGP
ncbi:MAG TPA: hypothetical protein VM889_08350 [Candidatus Thermoplasmatota archaeon]|nr:hypothetical protein [Candidatus Thermoplasmatota archaeon]